MISSHIEQVVCKCYLLLLFASLFKLCQRRAFDESSLSIELNIKSIYMQNIEGKGNTTRWHWGRRGDKGGSAVVQQGPVMEEKEQMSTWNG